MTPEQFAYNEYRDWRIYTELAQSEKVPEFKKILESLIQHEKNDFEFWVTYSRQKEFSISALEIMLYKLMRVVLGLTFTAKFLERHEEETVKNYKTFLETTHDAAMQAGILKIIEHEELHERTLIGQIKEEKVAFISNIILGLNDGLIELTGALVGFSFALKDHTLVALTGIITGVSAALSMASSAYMQAKHEQGKDAKKAAFYTGIAYAIVVVMLILPFFIFENILTSLALLFTFAFLIIFFMSLYTAILFDRPFKKQFFQMMFFSLGVAGITFLIGSVFRWFFDVGA